MKLERTYRLNVKDILRSSPLHFIVIGTGGTGGYLVRDLARQIGVLNHDRKTDHKLTLCDADIVEIANLVRQNFIFQDIDQNKAEVLANRYSAAYGIEIAYKDEYIESGNALASLAYQLHPKHIPVLIGCVDNNKTRQLITSFFEAPQRPLFYLDSGNEAYSGQCVCGFSSVAYSSNEQIESLPSSIFYMPCVTDLYPDIADDTTTKFISEMSCDERAVHHPQSIACNITAANILFNYCNQLLNAKEMEEISVNAVTFNVLGNGFKHYPNTKDQLAKRYVCQVSPEAAQTAAD